MATIASSSGPLTVRVPSTGVIAMFDLLVLWRSAYEAYVFLLRVCGLGMSAAAIDAIIREQTEVANVGAQLEELVRPRRAY